MGRTEIYACGDNVSRQSSLESVVLLSLKQEAPITIGGSTFTKTIEEQLKLLDEFWRLPENKKLSWTANNELQARYYDFMLEKKFLLGNANYI